MVVFNVWGCVFDFVFYYFVDVCGDFDELYELLDEGSEYVG